MSNFVWDETNPPEVKEDNPEEVVRTASLPSTQKYPASDFNNVRSALVDLRTAVLAGGVQVFNPLRYGASGLNDQNDAPYVQAAYDACVDAGGGIVYLPKPSVRYRMGKPLMVDDTVTSVKIVGPGMGMSCLGTSDFAGPLIFASPPYGLPLTTSKVAGGGLAADFRAATLGSRSDQLRFDLRWGLGGDLNGLSQFCWETFFTPDAEGSLRSLISGRTTLLPSDGARVALEVLLDGATGIVSASIRIGGVTETVNTGAFALTMDGAHTYHIALTYDGSTVRIFAAAPGASSPVRGSTAASGSVQQDACEDLYVGRSPIFRDPRGIIDAVYLSNTARYTGTFTAPSAKVTSPDANYRVVINFNENPGGDERLIGAVKFFGHGSGGIPAAIPVESTEYNAQVALSLYDMNVDGALYAVNAVQLDVQRCVFFSGRFGIYLDNNSFEVTLQKVRTQNCDRFGIRTQNASGVDSMRDILVNGSGDYAVWLKNFSGDVCNLYTGARKIAMIVDATGAQGGVVSMESVALTDEGFVPTNQRGCIAFVEPGVVSASGCIFQMLDGTAPLVLVDHATSAKATPLVFNGCAFDCGSNTSKFEFLNTDPVKGSVLVVNPSRSPFVSPDTVPWSDPDGLVTVLHNGGLACTTGISGTSTPVLNHGGSVTISDAATTGTVTFATSEEDADYMPKLTVGAGAGTPTISTPYWSGRTTGGFTINLPSAPGMGNSVVVVWELGRYA